MTRDVRHAAVVAAYESAGMASANRAQIEASFNLARENEAEAWWTYRRLSHAFARDFPTYELPTKPTNESLSCEIE